jgi:hypothetical protein
MIKGKCIRLVRWCSAWRSQLHLSKSSLYPPYTIHTSTGRGWEGRWYTCSVLLFSHDTVRELDEAVGEESVLRMTHSAKIQSTEYELSRVGSGGPREKAIHH